ENAAATSQTARCLSAQTRSTWVNSRFRSISSAAAASAGPSERARATQSGLSYKTSPMSRPPVRVSGASKHSTSYARRSPLIWIKDRRLGTAARAKWGTVFGRSRCLRRPADLPARRGAPRRGCRLGRLRHSERSGGRKPPNGDLDANGRAGSSSGRPARRGASAFLIGADDEVAFAHLVARDAQRVGGVELAQDQGVGLPADKLLDQHRLPLLVNNDVAAAGRRL